MILLIANDNNYAKAAILFMLMCQSTGGQTLDGTVHKLRHV